MAAAGALSVAVHAAVLFASASSGSSTSTGAPPAPPLQTRLITMSEPAVTAPPEPVRTTPPPVAARIGPVPSAEPLRTMPVAPTIDREPLLSRPAAAPPAPPLVPPPPAQPPPAPPPPAPPAIPDPLPAPRQPVAAPTASPPVMDAPPIPTPPAPTLTYHGSLGLDPPPRPLSDIEQLVPEAAGSRGGTVVLRLFINEQGTVDKAEVLRSTPPGLFDATALEAASRARFSPGYLAGVPVKSQVTFEVKYRALGSGSEAAGRTY